MVNSQMVSDPPRPCPDGDLARLAKPDDEPGQDLLDEILLVRAGADD